MGRELTNCFDPLGGRILQPATEKLSRCFVTSTSPCNLRTFQILDAETEQLGDRRPTSEKSDRERETRRVDNPRQNKNRNKPLQFTATRGCHLPASPVPISSDLFCKKYERATLGRSTVPPHNSVEASHRTPVSTRSAVEGQISSISLRPRPQLADQLSDTEAAHMKRWWGRSDNWNLANACERGIHLISGSYRVCVIICDFKESKPI